MKRLPDEPKFEAISYTAYVINEYDFCIEDLKLIKTTQNNVVSIKRSKFSSNVGTLNLHLRGSLTVTLSKKS